MNEMKVTFPGGQKVNALWKGFEIATDQEGGAPTPFDLFLASLATCAGIFVLGFINSRGLSAEGLGLSASFERDPQTHTLSRAAIKITLPAGFPEKYRGAVIKAAEQCLVKRTIDNPPKFEVSAE
jgi:putative redox protein